MAIIIVPPPSYHRAFAPTIVRIKGLNSSEKRTQIYLNNESDLSQRYTITVELLYMGSDGLSYADVNIQAYVCSFFKHGEQAVRYGLSADGSRSSHVALRAAAQVGERTDMGDLCGKVLTDLTELKGYDGYPLSIGVIGKQDDHSFYTDNVGFDDRFKPIYDGLSTYHIIPQEVVGTDGKPTLDYSCSGQTVWIRPTTDNVRWDKYHCQLELVDEDVFTVKAYAEIPVDLELIDTVTGENYFAKEQRSIGASFAANRRVQLTTVDAHSASPSIISGYYVNGRWVQAWLRQPHAKAYVYSFVVTEDTFVEVVLSQSLRWGDYVCQLDEDGKNTGYGIATNLYFDDGSYHSILGSFPLANSGTMVPAITEQRYRELPEVDRAQRERNFIDSISDSMSFPLLVDNLLSNDCVDYDVEKCPLPVPDYILVNNQTESSANFDVDGGHQSVEINSSQPWALHLSDYYWINVQPKSGGAGTTTVQVTADENKSSYGRAADLVFRHNTEEAKSAKFIVSQDRSNVVYISLSLDLDYNGEQISRVSAWLPSWAVGLCTPTIGGVIHWKMGQGGESRSTQFSVKIGDNANNNSSYGESFVDIDSRASDIEFEVDKVPDSCGEYEVIVEA